MFLVCDGWVRECVGLTLVIKHVSRVFFVLRTCFWPVSHRITRTVSIVNEVPELRGAFRSEKLDLVKFRIQYPEQSKRPSAGKSLGLSIRHHDGSDWSIFLRGMRGTLER